MAETKAPSIEELPFGDFIQQHLLPAIQTAFSDRGITDIKVHYNKLQIHGNWRNQTRQFIIFFAKEDINGQKAFACADGCSTPQTLEPFLIDERKVNLNLLVFGLMQRINSQKWLQLN